MIEEAEKKKKNWKSNQINRKINLFILLNKPLRVFHIAEKKISSLWKKRRKKYFRFTKILEQKTAMVKISICHAMPRLRVVLIFLISFAGKALPKKRPCWYRESQNVAGVNRTQEPSKDFEKSHKVSKVVKIISLSSRCRLTGCIRTRIDKKGLTLEITEDKHTQPPQH